MSCFRFRALLATTLAVTACGDQLSAPESSPDPEDVGGPVFALSAATRQFVLIPNGNFETGNLLEFNGGGVNGGFASVVREGTAFSCNTTTGLILSGDFAANVRSSPPAPTNSIGILTSDPFIAGFSIAFVALSENSDLSPDPDPVTFEVRIFDQSDNVLSSQVLATNVVTLSPAPGCVGGEPRDGTFSDHSIDTSALLGSWIKLQFRQHTNVAGQGFFTLVDDITIEVDVIGVEIDIKPGSDPNCFNNDGNGVIPVAILGAADFDVAQVEPSTVELEGLSVGARGKSGKLMAHVEDVNGDGFDDLVIQIEDVDGTFTSGSGTATLSGRLADGSFIEGSDDICVVS